MEVRLILFLTYHKNKTNTKPNPPVNSVFEIFTKRTLFNYKKRNTFKIKVIRKLFFLITTKIQTCQIRHL